MPHPISEASEVTVNSSLPDPTELVSSDTTQGVDSHTLCESMLRHLRSSLAKDQYSVTPHDSYVALVYAVREQLVDRWLRTQQGYYHEDQKRVYYLSMEYLTGRMLVNSLINLGLLEQCRTELAALGIDLEVLIAVEAEAGLGNGGLGRLAACLMDSFATQAFPVCGYGIRFEYGIFEQRIADGFQVEMPDHWLRFGNPWEIARPEDVYCIGFGGYVRELQDSRGRLQHEWIADEDVTAMAYDMPVAGYQNDTVNTLRLWAAESRHGFNLECFNRGDYVAAVEATSRSKSISRVLYPNDNVQSGKELRLKQEYFFVSASLQDIVRRYKKTRQTFDAFPEKVAIQLNDTHPALGIPELMRILVDLEQLDWQEAWDITEATFGYTNHTLLPEALEEWPVALLQRVLPRHLQIIYEINHRFLQAVKRKHPGDVARLHRMSLIGEGDEQRVRMSHLALVGSHAINGVSQLHSDLLRKRVFVDFDEFFPWRFHTTTNGISPRRWLKQANPPLAELISDSIGDAWVRDLSQLEGLTAYADDPEFSVRWAEVKRENKRRLAAQIGAEQGIDVSVDSIFSCQVKRIHEYKRQLLNILHTIALYNRIRHGDTTEIVPRTVMISGKAAPGYAIARTIIKLFHDVAEVINNDPRVAGVLKLVFLPNYNVSLAESIFPATDVSEQISTAGTEASGTGNMKAMLNGALTVGTLDGANIEIAEAVGRENIFIFGKTADDVARAFQDGYEPRQVCDSIPALREAVDMIRDGFFSAGDKTAFQPLLESVFSQGDRFMVLADFADYVATQQQVEGTYRDQMRWTQMSIINVARAGRFSCDRTALTYAKEIWDLDLDDSARINHVPR